jgi:hypothetical protein
VLADTTTSPTHTLEEFSSHYYAGSHCGSSTLKLSTLMSDATWLKTRTKVQGIMDVGARVDDKVPSVINESNSASCSGQPDVSNAYGTSLWSLDYLMQATQLGISRLQFHTNTRAICGDFKERTSPDYPISFRYYGAFCAADQAAYDAEQLSATPLYYGIWAFHQVPRGRFVDLDLPDSELSKVRAYGVLSNDGSLTFVLVNVQDPSSADSTSDAVTLNLPTSYRSGRALTLASSAPGGLASLDASAITLGGRSVNASGIPAGAARYTPVGVHGTTSTVTVAPGTAQIVTFARHH